MKHSASYILYATLIFCSCTVHNSPKPKQLSILDEQLPQIAALPTKRSSLNAAVIVPKKTNYLIWNWTNGPTSKYQVEYKTNINDSLWKIYLKTTNGLLTNEVWVKLDETNNKAFFRVASIN